MTQIRAALDHSAAGRRTSRPPALLVPLLALLLVGAGGAVAVQNARSEPREVRLLARDMAFYLPGDPTPNPRLVAERGEPLRLVLENGERGLPHDVSVPDGDRDRRRSREVRGLGETATLAFRAPEQAGSYEYVCTLHSRMMRGVLEVR